VRVSRDEPVRRGHQVSRRSARRARSLVVVVAAGAAALDQVGKRVLAVHEAGAVLGPVHVVLTHNPGLAFGTLAGHPGLATLIDLGTSVLLLVLGIRLSRETSAGTRVLWVCCSAVRSATLWTASAPRVSWTGCGWRATRRRSTSRTSSSACPVSGLQPCSCAMGPARREEVNGPRLPAALARRSDGDHSGCCRCGGGEHPPVPADPELGAVRVRLLVGSSRTSTT